MPSFLFSLILIFFSLDDRVSTSLHGSTSTSAQQTQTYDPSQSQGSSTAGGPAIYYPQNMDYAQQHHHLTAVHYPATSPLTYPQHPQHSPILRGAYGSPYTVGSSPLHSPVAPYPSYAHHPYAVPNMSQELVGLAHSPLNFGSREPYLGGQYAHAMTLGSGSYPVLASPVSSGSPAGVGGGANYAPGRPAPQQYHAPLQLSPISPQQQHHHHSPVAYQGLPYPNQSSPTASFSPTPGINVSSIAGQPYSPYTTPSYPRAYQPMTPHSGFPPGAQDEQSYGTWLYLPPGTPAPTSPYDYPPGYSYMRFSGPVEGPPLSSIPPGQYGISGLESPVNNPPQHHRAPHMHQHPGGGSGSAGRQGNRVRLGPSGLNPNRPGITSGVTSASSLTHATPEPDIPPEDRGLTEQHRDLPRSRSPPSSQHPDPESAQASPSRRAYHPNPPTTRSEWVMWVGNVPADSTQDEMWQFFTESDTKHPPPRPMTDLRLLTDGDVSSRPSSQGEGSEARFSINGISSVFLISQSNCAFINFEEEDQLQVALKKFNGKQLRPYDPRCPRLVCRIRKRQDDLKAGVGAQRGMGMHTRWVKSQTENAQKAARSHQPIPHSREESAPGSIPDGFSEGDEHEGESSSNPAASSHPDPGVSLVFFYFCASLLISSVIG